MNHGRLFVKNTGSWHFNSVVYSGKQNKLGELNENDEAKKKTDIYNEIMLNSMFMSFGMVQILSVWEALGCGSINSISGH